MRDHSIEDPNKRLLLEQLRLQVNRVDALERKIIQLEHEQREQQQQQQQQQQQEQHRNQSRVQSADFLASTVPNGHFSAIGRGITESKLSQEALLFQAQHDPLTTLFNRAMFNQTVAHAIARSDRYLSSEIALLVINLDGFNVINDSYGYANGDEVLKITATRLRSCQRKSDEIFRLGGDEFAWLIEGRAPLCVERLAQRIIDVIGLPTTLAGSKDKDRTDDIVVHIGCSIGIATYPFSTVGDVEQLTLFQQAAAAMQSVKRNGRNSYGRFEVLLSDGVAVG